MATSSYGSSSGSGTSTSTSTPVVAPINQQIASLLQTLSGHAQALGDQTYQWANQQYNKTSKVTDQMVNDANTYSSPSRIAQAMGQHEADVGQGMEQSAANASEELRKYGINPADGRYAALKTTQAAQEGAAKVQAGALARQQTEDTGRQLRAQAVNASLANTNTATAGMAAAGGFTNTAANALKYAPANNASTSQSQNTSSSMQRGAGQDPTGGGGGGGSSGGGSGGGGSSSGGSSPSGDWNPSSYTQDSGAWGGPISTQAPDAQFMSTTGLPNYDNGSGTGAGNNSFGTPIDATPPSDSGGTAGGGYQDVPQYDSTAYAAGGDVGQGGIPDDTTTGGQVPQNASPSQGMQTDDVPANLNAGEFVVPRDVAHWKGEEFFQKLIAQSRKARMGAPGKGQPGPALQGAPRFASQAMGA